MRDNESYALIEGYLKLSNIELPVELNNVKLSSLMDTGSTHNYITQKMIDKIKEETQNLPVIAYAERANGETIKIERTCK